MKYTVTSILTGTVLCVCIIGFLMWSILSVPGKNTQSETVTHTQQGDLSVSGFTPPSLTSRDTASTTSSEESSLSVSSTKSYITITNSCDHNYIGECVRVRSGPGLNFPIVTRLRNDIILMIDPDNETYADGHVWYKIIFDEFLQYPERVTTDWYVANEYVTHFTDEGVRTLEQNRYETTNKKIVVDRSSQTLTAYEGDIVAMTLAISTGLLLTPTPRGTFAIFRKTPTRYMQGPLKNVPSQYYDLPGVPWNLYFTEDGAVIHGAYWHKSFGHPYSHGCVNVLPSDARALYYWADLGTQVIVVD